MNKTVFQSIFIPFAALLVAFALVAFLVSALAFSAEGKGVGEDILVESSLLVANALAGPIAAGDTAAMAATARDLARGTGYRITVVARDGNVVADTLASANRLENHRDRPELVAAFATGQGVARRPSATIGTNTLYAARSVPGPDGSLFAARVAIPENVVLAGLSRSLLPVGLALVAALLAALAVSFTVARSIARPCSQLSVAAARFATGDPGARSVIRAPRELMDLSATFNHMADQLRARLAELDAERRSARATLDGMSEAILVVDNETRLQSMNPAAKGLYPASGTTLLEVTRCNELERVTLQSIREGRAVQTETTLYGKSPRFFQANASPLPSGGAVISLSDVTRLRLLESVRRDFVANVSHELRTPITSIRGFVESLLDGAIEDRDTANRFLTIVNRQTLRMQEIIDDLLTLASLERDGSSHLQTERCLIAPLLDAVLSQLEARAAARSISLQADCPASLQATVNPGLLEQAVANLADNAIKYSEPGSTVTIQALAGSPDPQGLAPLTIRVSDTGSGIPQADLPRIFERFYRVDRARTREGQGGSGLGLAIVKHIALAHGGSVNAESREGKGSTFSLTVPGAANL